MTKRPRPWGDNEDHSRIRKNHLSQRDIEKRSESAMVSVHTKTMNKLFQGSKTFNSKTQLSCDSCVTSTSNTSKLISPCPSCQSMACSNCIENCENCSRSICGRCSIQDTLNYYSRRCLYCWKCEFLYHNIILKYYLSDQTQIKVYFSFYSRWNLKAEKRLSY